MQYILKIKELRMKQHMSQLYLSDKLGISQGYLSEVENNKYDIPTSLFLKLLKEFDVGIDVGIEEIDKD